MTLVTQRYTNSANGLGSSLITAHRIQRVLNLQVLRVFPASAFIFSASLILTSVWKQHLLASCSFFLQTEHVMMILGDVALPTLLARARLR